MNHPAPAIPPPASPFLRTIAAAAVAWALVLTFWPFLPVGSVGRWAERLAEAVGFVDRAVPLHLPAAALLVALIVLAFPRLLPWSLARRVGFLLVAAAVAELLQAGVVGRHASLLDVAAHVLGALVGWAIAARLSAISPPPPLGRFAVPVLWLACVLATLLLVAHAAYEHRITSLRTWDEDARLVLGNEATGDRPWHGTITGVAIYDAALDERQVRRIARESWDEDDGLVERLKRRGRAVYGSLPRAIHQLTPTTALRWVNVGRANDRLDLVAPGSAGVAAAPDHQGVAFSGHLQALAATPEPAAALTHALRRRGTFSVEATVAPASLAQDGPARIVSLSRTPGQRNFTLAQRGDAVAFRVRTPLTGPNGTAEDGEALWPGVFEGASPRHLLVTYGHGTLRLYVDGETFGEPFPLQAIYRLKRFPVVPTIVGVALAALLPLGLAGPALLALTRRPRLTLIAWLAITLLAVAAFGYAMGPGAWAFALAAAALGTLLGVTIRVRV